MSTYLERHNASGLKVGDKVKVLRMAYHKEQGWDNIWEQDMDVLVDKEAIITSDQGVYGFALNGGYRYPHFVLSKVIDKPKPCQLHDREVEEPRKGAPVKVTLEFDLTDTDGIDAWHRHKQANELYSFAFEVLHNLRRNFDYYMEEGTLHEPSALLGQLIEDIAVTHNIDVV